MKQVVLVLAVLVVVAGPFELPRALVLGWLFFLYRTLPRMTVDWPSVLVGCAALLLFTVGVHAAGRTWLRHSVAWPRWKLRWSITTVAVVVLLFAAGISVVGIVHQVGWLVTSPEPHYIQTIRWRGYAATQNNLREIGIDMTNCADTHAGRFPAGGTFTADGRMLHSWETSILPYIPYSIQDIDLNVPWDDPRNARYFQCIIPQFVNANLPSPAVFDEWGFGLSHYAANSHVLAANNGLHFEDVTDGLPNTFLIGEVNANFEPWGHPVNWRDPARGINRSPHGFGGPPSAGGAYFSMADGSVRFVSERISPEVLRALSTPAGGERIDVSVLGSER
jgi:hypothetical protein